MRMIIKNRSKEILITPIKNLSVFGKIRGLMFSSRKNAEALLFNFRKPSRIPIHSFFVFFPFVAVWLDDKNKIIETRVVYPFTLSVLPKNPYSKIIEIPVNRKYKQIKELLVGD